MNIIEQELASIEHDLKIAEHELWILECAYDKDEDYDGSDLKQINAWKKLIAQLNDRTDELMFLKGDTLLRDVIEEEDNGVD